MNHNPHNFNPELHQ